MAKAIMIQGTMSNAGKSLLAAGLGFLDTETVFSKEKRRTRVHGRITDLPGILRPLVGMEIEGYEIHMGWTTVGNCKDRGSVASDRTDYDSTN